MSLLHRLTLTGSAFALALGAAAHAADSPFLGDPALRRAILRVQGHHVLIQNDDSGWDYLVASADELKDTTNATFPNQFGNNALSLLSTYPVHEKPELLQGIKWTAEYLMLQPVHRKLRIYPSDEAFLIEAAKVFGYSAYQEKAVLNQQAEKDMGAAVFLLGEPDPSEDAVNAIPQEDLDARTDAERVAGLDLRFTAFGLNAGIKGANWAARVYNSLLLNDLGYAKAFADLVYDDLSEITIDEPYYLLGLATSLYCLMPFRDQDSRFPAAIESIRAAILAQQKTSGLFGVEAEEGVVAGDLDDQSNLMFALFQLGETAALRRQVQAMLALQLPSGAFQNLLGTPGSEYVAAQAGFMSVLSSLWLPQPPARSWTRRSSVPGRLPAVQSAL